MRRRTFCLTLLWPAGGLPAADTGQWTKEQMEEFLRTAEVVRRRVLSVGITGSQRATLTDGRTTHDAHFQTIDEYRQEFRSDIRTELNFRDSYKYNIAAYRLDKLLGLNMVPVSVERKIGGRSGAVTWWVDDVQMMEKDRLQKKIEPPDQRDWNDQIYQVRVFNQLVYNTDPNLGNLLIARDWKVWMVDFTRAFRWHKELQNAKNLVQIDRRVYEGLRRLNEEVLNRELGDCLRRPEIAGVLARRDKIVTFFEAEAAKLGEAAVICDRPGH